MRKLGRSVVTLAVALAAMGLLFFGGRSVAAGSPGSEGDEALARRYVPVFYFHPAEIFRPQPVEVIVEQARLRQSRRLWFDVNLLLEVDVDDLFDLDTDAATFLDVWYGDEGGSAYTNYSAHQAYYQAALSPEAGGLPATVYAHVVRGPDYVTIQYWAFYYYNDWFNKHEGDWEMVQIILDAHETPLWVVLSQHHGGTRRSWAHAPVEDGSHPAVYVALGSHANYFVGDEVYPNGQDVGSTRIEIMDRTGQADRTVPQVILVPDRGNLMADAGRWPGAAWLPFRGHWGEMAFQSDLGGPLGPADKGEQWASPYEWGMAQPLDTDSWYAHRVRVQVVGLTPGAAHVQLGGRSGDPLPAMESLGRLAILHADPPGEGVVAEITVPPGTRGDILATWPDRRAGQVTWFGFSGVDFVESGRATLDLGPGPVASLRIEGEGPARQPTRQETVEATWDAPDLVWVGGGLPAHQVGAGLLLALSAAVLPALVYVGGLYWLDRYEKEPAVLLAAAFVWGAIPAVATSLVTLLVFRLPPDLVGPEAAEAIRLGLVAPVLDEGLKAVAVLFIAWRFRWEFDNILDGIIYGAVVGFGFATTGNVVSYVGSFILWGFGGLGVVPLAQGTIQALNHALYTAIFGAALGAGRLAPSGWQRRATGLVGFVVAVLAHATHSLLARTVLGLNGVTVLITGAGLLFAGVVAGASLARQRRCLREALPGEVPEDLYRVLTTPGARGRVLYQALVRSGFSAWWQMRRRHQLCVELAFRKMQYRRRPAEAELTAEIDRLREAIQTA